jgi:hypothetical protein
MFGEPLFGLSIWIVDECTNTKLGLTSILHAILSSDFYCFTALITKFKKNTDDRKQSVSE